MTKLQRTLAVIASIAGLLGLASALSYDVEQLPYVVVFAAASLMLFRLWRPLSFWLDGIIGLATAIVLLTTLANYENAPTHLWIALLSTWLFTWLFVEEISSGIKAGKLSTKVFGFIIPALFGLILLFAWEVLARGANVPQVILPPPSSIFARIMVSGSILWADFQQTFMKAVLAGYVIGCSSGFIVAIIVDRSPFLKRGLLPIGNFVSALPIIGIAPIMVMWFGFDWQSKAAVVVAMTFFPMLVNTVAGLNATSTIERDLMRTYASSYSTTLMKLRLPFAAPFIFNALKINSTLALIGAIVAEFFGTPIVGMGFRISTEVGKLAIDLVWAEIAVAAVAGSAFYGAIALIERAVTFWHPSVRSGRA